MVDTGVILSAIVLYLPLQRTARRRLCGGALSLREKVAGEGKGSRECPYIFQGPGSEREMVAHGPVMAAKAATAVAKKENMPCQVGPAE